MRASLSIGSIGMAAILVTTILASAHEIQPVRFSPPAPDTLIIAAMRSELRRNVDSLKLRGEPGPHFISYTMWDMQGFHAQASMGSLEQAQPDRTRMIDVDVRVGSYEHDQSEYEGGVVFGPRLRAPVPETNDTLLLRQALWALTDARYKVALEQLAQKKSFLAGHHGVSPLPDWSRQQALQQRDIDPVIPVDTAVWMNLCRRLSASLGKNAWLAESRVAFQYYYTTFYYVDSEGASYIQSLQENTLLAALLCQARDGSPLWEYFRLSARDSLPGGGRTGETAFGNLDRQLDSLARRLDYLRQAPAMELYRGPVLFSGTAAGEVLYRTLLQPQTNLREPISETSEPSFLLGMSGRKYLPATLSVRDDPARQRFGDKLLFGSYKFDHQGQPAQAIDLIRSGRITDFYRGKVPLQASGHVDNGHWRYGGGFPGVVNVTATDGVLEKVLVDSLRALTLEEGAPQGLRINKLADEDAWKLLRHPLMQSLPFADAGDNRGNFALPIPVSLDAVDVKTGAWIPVRGLSLNPLDSKSLRDIVAVGKTQNLLEPQSSFSLLCPSLLFSLLDLRGKSRVQPRLPILP